MTGNDFYCLTTKVLYVVLLLLTITFCLLGTVEKLKMNEIIEKQKVVVEYNEQTALISKEIEELRFENEKTRQEIYKILAK